MKRYVFMAWAGLALAAAAAELGELPSWPLFREVQKGRWTMNYEGALAQARSDGSPVFLYFEAALWCPHCKEMEANIFSRPEWKERVKDVYLVQLDFPRRDEGIDTLLKYAPYLAAVGITAEQGRAVTLRNWQLHNQYTTPGGTRVGFPTVVVLDSNGLVRGRFSEHDRTATYDPLPTVLEIVDQLLGLQEGESDSFYPGAILLPAPTAPDAVMTNGPHALGIVDTDDWYRFTPAEDGAAAWSFTLAQADETNGTFTLSLYKNPALPPVASVTKALSERPSVVCVPPVFGGDYYLRVSAKQLAHHVDYLLTYAATPTNRWGAVVQTEPEATSVPRTAASVTVDVRFRRFGAAGPCSARVFAAELGASDARAGLQFAAVTNAFEWAEGQTEGLCQLVVPLANPQPDVWQGDKKFLVKLEPLSNCTAAASLTLITLTETRARNAGVVAFSGFGPVTNGFALPAAPSFNAPEGSKQLVWVTRSSGADGPITAKVTYPLEDHLVDKLVSWAAGESGPKSVSLYMPGPAETPQVRQLEITLTGDAAAPVIPATAGKITVNVTPAGAPAFVDKTAAYTLATEVNCLLDLAVANGMGGTVKAKLASGRLPAGVRLKLVDGTVRFEGVPRQEGVYTASVLLSAASGGKTFPGEVRTFTFTVLPLRAINPAPEGVYDGVLIKDNVLLGVFSLTSRTGGPVAVKVKTVAGQQAFPTKYWSAADAPGGLLFIRATRGGMTLDITVQADGRVQGTVLLADGTETEAFGSKRAVYSAAAVGKVEGYYTLALPVARTFPDDPAMANVPAGSGYLTLTITGAMKARYSGRLADGTPVSGSAPCLNLGRLTDGLDKMRREDSLCVPVVVPLYGRRGSFTALLTLSSQERDLIPKKGVAVGVNSLRVANSMWVYPGKSRAMSEDRFATTVDRGYGAYYGTLQDLADYYEGWLLDLSQPRAALDPKAVQLSANGGRLGVSPEAGSDASFRAEAATGLFKGRFGIDSDSGVRTRVSYAGVLVPAYGRGEGYFLFTDAAWKIGYKLKRSYLVEVMSDERL